MTTKEFADRMNGREYGKEITDDIIDIAYNSGFVIVFGASDDLCELHGAIYDEAGCYDGGTIYLTPTGLFQSKRNDEDCPYAAKEREKCKTIEAVWGEDGYSWIYETDIPHETFDILEDGEKYCRGIVFELSSLA